MNIRQEIQAVVKFNDKILVVNKDNHWRLPKGGLNEGETSLDALHRELREEIHLVDYLSIRQYYDYSFNSPGENHIVIVFEVLTSQKKIIVDQRELTDSRWVSFIEALKMLYFKEEKDCITEYLMFIRGVKS